MEEELRICMGGVERASRQVSERHRPLSSQTGVLLTAPFVWLLGALKRACCR